MASTSRASSAGPMPRPTGCLAVAGLHFDHDAQRLADAIEALGQRCDACRERTLAVRPTGMSISTWVAPAAAFLDITEATIRPSLSSPSGRSTRISKSSAGLSATARPTPRSHLPARPHAAWWPGSSATGARVSMVSAVPAGEVIARDDVLGINRPQAATIGTTSSVVRLLGRPPTQCLSSTICCCQSSRCPTATMARVSAMVSATSMRSPEQAVISAAISMSE
jgi:hypothetical protein